AQCTGTAGAGDGVSRARSIRRWRARRRQRAVADFQQQPALPAGHLADSPTATQASSRPFNLWSYDRPVVSREWRRAILDGNAGGVAPRIKKAG
ncbi:MAG TPA: hypothetical protein VEY92_05100, partial [Pseudoxanthomonas sp.]|nr:hypothetical protein [Pseudoxanthomonas sp.]